jgi:Putative metallopeptidase
MKRLICAAVFLIAGWWPLAALGQTNTASKIDIAYVEPDDAIYRRHYDELKRRQVLEALQDFLSPLKLDRRVVVQVRQCGKMIEYYQHGGPVTICYEYVEKLFELAKKIPADAATAAGVSREDAVVGAFVQIVLQQMSHAMFDIFRLPVWGREEDAADKLAGFLMLQFGEDNARRAIAGSAYFFDASDRTWTGSDFADIYSTEAQRYYNTLCIAYGGAPAAFSTLVEDASVRGTSASPKRRSSDVNLLPRERAVRCAHEYSDIAYAFNRTIMPHVDQELLQKVLARHDWLQMPHVRNPAN